MLIPVCQTRNLLGNGTLVAKKYTLFLYLFLIHINPCLNSFIHSLDRISSRFLSFFFLLSLGIVFFVCFASLCQLVWQHCWTVSYLLLFTEFFLSSPPTIAIYWSDT